jgi:hypothetical protein
MYNIKNVFFSIIDVVVVVVVMIIEWGVRQHDFFPITDHVYGGV